MVTKRQVVIITDDQGTETRLYSHLKDPIFNMYLPVIPAEPRKSLESLLGPLKTVFTETIEVAKVENGGTQQVYVKSGIIDIKVVIIEKRGYSNPKVRIDNLATGKFAELQGSIFFTVPQLIEGSTETSDIWLIANNPTRVQVFVEEFAPAHTLLINGHLASFIYKSK